MSIEYMTRSELRAHIEYLKSKKKRNGTAIFYAERRLRNFPKSPPTPSKPKKPKVKSPRVAAVDKAKACPENRAYVLSREIHDLTQAIVALGRIRTEIFYERSRR